MTNTKLFRIFFCSLVLLTSQVAYADSEMAYTSYVKGVGFWNIYGKDANHYHDVPTNDHFVTFKDGNHAEFVSYCNGKRKVYIYELGSKTFVCKSEIVKAVNDGQFWSEGSVEINILGITSFFKTNYDYDLNLFTVSKYPIPQKSWKLYSLTKSDVAQVINAAKFHIKKRANTDEDKYTVILGKYLKYAKKLKLSGKNLLLIPTQEINNENGTDIILSVFELKDNTYKYIGEIWGVPQLGADVDGDGVPEIVTNTESPIFVNSTGYYKIYPQVKLLMSYDDR